MKHFLLAVTFFRQRGYTLGQYGEEAEGINKIGYVRITLILRRVRATIVAVGKQ
jgi:hypothetical protein